MADSFALLSYKPQFVSFAVSPETTGILKKLATDVTHVLPLFGVYYHVIV